MKDKDHNYPVRSALFLRGKDFRISPVEKTVRIKRLKSVISYNPIVCEYRWTDCLSEAETPTWFRFYRDGRVSYWFMDGFYHGFRITQPEVVNQLISCIDKNNIYALPERINSTCVMDGIYQSFTFFDGKGQEIVKISGHNPWYAYYEIRILTNLLTDIIKPYTSRLPRQKPEYDMFDANRHSEALHEAKNDVEEIINRIVFEDSYEENS